MNVMYYLIFKIVWNPPNKKIVITHQYYKFVWITVAEEQNLELL